MGKIKESISKLEIIVKKLKLKKPVVKNINYFLEVPKELKALAGSFTDIKTSGAITFAVNTLKGVSNGLKENADRKFLQRQVNRAVFKLEKSIDSLRASSKPKKIGIFELPKTKKLTDQPFSYVLELCDKIGRRTVLLELLKFAANKDSPYYHWAQNIIKKFQQMLDWKEIIKELYSKEAKEEAEEVRLSLLKKQEKEELENKEQFYLSHMKRMKVRLLDKDEIFGLVENPVILVRSMITHRGQLRLEGYGYKLGKVAKYPTIENCPLVGIHVTAVKKKNIMGALIEACSWINEENSGGDLQIASPPIQKGTHYYAIVLDRDLLSSREIIIKEWSLL
jgi:hypothetical protein